MFGQMLFRNARYAQRLTQVRYSGHGAPPYYGRVGNREHVGFGSNGKATYIDMTDFPFPAVRFREETSEIKSSDNCTLGIKWVVQALRQKEKGDWKLLSQDEKKCLYRFSYCRTFAEMTAPTGRWKQILGMTLILVSIGIWAELAIYKFVYTPEMMPPSLSLESRQAQLRRIIDSRVNPITGISSKWDYDKDEWKK